MMVMLELEDFGDGFSVMLLLILWYWKEEGLAGWLFCSRCLPAKRCVFFFKFLQD